MGSPCLKYVQASIKFPSYNIVKKKCLQKLKYYLTKNFTVSVMDKNISIRM